MIGPSEFMHLLNPTYNMRYENGLVGDRGDLETAREFHEQARRGGIAVASNKLEIRYSTVQTNTRSYKPTWRLVPYTPTVAADIVKNNSKAGAIIRRCEQSSFLTFFLIADT